MRKGFLWTFCSLLAVAGAAHAQQWPWYPSADTRPGFPPAAAPMANAPTMP